MVNFFLVFGVPGAGKTVLCNSVLTAGKGKFVYVHSGDEVRKILVEKKIRKKVWELSPRESQAIKKELFARLEYDPRFAGKNVLVDIHATTASQKSSNTFFRLVSEKSIGMFAGVILLTTNPTELKRRRLRRGNADDLKDFAGIKIEEFVERAEVQAIVTHAKKPLLILNTQNDGAQLVRKVLNFVKSAPHYKPTPSSVPLRAERFSKIRRTKIVAPKVLSRPSRRLK